MTISDRLARFNRLVPNRVVRLFAGRLAPLAVVEHSGRRSGRRYRTPVMAFRTEGGFVVSLPYGSGRDWVRNVLAAGGCTLVRAGRRHVVTGPVLLGPEGLALVPAWTRPAFRLLRVRGFVRLPVSR